MPRQFILPFTQRTCRRKAPSVDTLRVSAVGPPPHEACAPAQVSRDRSRPSKDWRLIKDSRQHSSLTGFASSSSRFAPSPNLSSLIRCAVGRETWKGSLPTVPPRIPSRNRDQNYQVREATRVNRPSALSSWFVASTTWYNSNELLLPCSNIARRISSFRSLTCRLLLRPHSHSTAFHF